MDLLVNIDVDDLERAMRFYTGAFDLRVGRRFGASAVELLGGTSPIYLLEKAPAARRPANRTSKGTMPATGPLSTWTWSLRTSAAVSNAR